jgi:branched-chain amino acid transport system substrate-binding protein
MGTRWFIGTALVVSCALFAASCGSSGGGGEKAATTTAGNNGSGVTTTSASSTSAAATLAATPANIDEWEKLWATERAAVVKRIKDNKWGKSSDGKTLTGPEGFRIDLSKCGPGWSDTEGLTDTEIKIGGTSPQSGTAADFGYVAKASDPYFKYYAAKGLFKDSTGKTRTKVNFTYRDDVYDPAKTIPLVDELLDSEKVFALWVTGTPNGLKVYDKINSRCVPNPLLIGGSPAWGDPVNHPWTTGSLMSYGTEATIWMAFIEQHIDELTKGKNKAVVAGFVANSEFGATYESSFRAALAQSPVKDKIDFVTERVEITAPTVTDPMTTLASKNPDIFFTMSGGAQCPQIISEAANNGMKQKTKYVFMSSVCKSASYVGKAKVGGDGSAADGWYIVGGGLKDFNSDAMASDSFVAWGRKFLADNGLDYKASGNLGAGLYYAWTWVQALIIAGELDGGLTRTNLIVAQRAISGTNPLLLPGIKFNMNGNSDPYFVEGSDLSVWNAAQQGWVQKGNVIELSGKTKPCAWDLSAQACKG